MNPVTAEQVKARESEFLELPLMLTMGQYEQMGDDLAEVRRLLKLPKSASNTEIIIAAVHRQAQSD